MRAPARPNLSQQCGHSRAQTPWRDRPFLQLKVAAEIIGLSPASLYRFSDEGKLTLKELGGRTLVETKSFIDLIDSAEDWTAKTRGKEARAARRKSGGGGNDA